MRRPVPSRAGIGEIPTDLATRHAGRPPPHPCPIEDRICCARNAGLGRFPSRDFAINTAWLTAVMIAVDLLAFTQSILLHDDTELAKAEPKTLRYRLLHVAARLVRTARRWHLKIDKDWPWATHLATAFTRLRAAPWPA